MPRIPHMVAMVVVVLALAAPARAAEPSSYVMLMLGDPTVDGGALSGTDLLLAVSQHETSLRSCFQGLPGQEGGRDEQVTVWLDLDAAGHVTSVKASSDGPGDRFIVERCLEGAVRLVSFPAPGGEGARVVLPIGMARLPEPEPRDIGAVIGPGKALQVGDPAPPLRIDTLIGAPDGTETTWEALQGKVVVVEFWATWCGPCLAAVPHMKAMATELAGEDVVFLSVTEEDEALIRPFLKEHPMPGWVGLDDDSETHAAYQIHGIPRAVVVGPDGAIVEVTHPESLTAATLRAQLPDRSSTLTSPGK